MKKLFTLSVALIACATSFAQKTVTFCDLSTGEEIANGTVITRSEAVSTHGKTIIYSGLALKNTSAEEDEYCVLDWEIKDMASGAAQVCFPQACRSIPNNTDGVTYPYNGGFTSDGSISDVDYFEPANAAKSIESEWLPTTGSYGNCTIIYRLYKMDWNPDNPSEMSPSVKGSEPMSTVTVNYIYGDPAGINDVTDNGSATVASRYSATGQLLQAPQKGVNIVRLSNGKTIKTIAK